MKALMSDIQARIDAQVTYLNKVMIVSDPNDAQADANAPFATLSDRGLSRELSKWNRIESLTVRVTAYQEILRDEATMMGSGTNKGLFDITSDIEAALWNWLPAGYHDVRITEHYPAEIVGGDNQFMARRAIDVIYRREITGE